jgi:gliding motility-associated-like protein
MKKICFYLLCLLLTPMALFSQMQISVGGTATTEVFNDVKYDASDGSTINVGTIGVSGVGTGTDCYLVKLNAAKQIVWQKTIVNAGNDFLSKVRVCANGDYIASGEYTQNGLQWGIVFRINSTTGNIIWSTTSIGTASEYGDQFYNLMETANGDIAVVGSTDFISGPVNSMVVLLSSTGIQKWCRVADFNSSDEIQTVNQLPNGNLIICGHYYQEYTRYIAFVMELDEPTGSVINKTDYAINMADPIMSGNTLNTLWPANGFVTNGNVMFEIGLTQGCCGPGGDIALCSYDQTTKALTCNLYYHKGYPNSGSDAVNVLNTGDYIIAEAIANPANIENLYVSRVTNGTIVYDRRLSTTDTYINAIDINGSNVFLSGADKRNSGDGYSLFSTAAFPGSAGSCIFPDADSLVILPITPVQTADTISLNSVSGVMIPLTLVTTPANGIVTTLCGCVPDSSTIDTTICQGQNYLGHSTAGTYVDTLTNAAGCDSIRTLNLTINNNCVSSKQCSGAAHIVWKDDFGSGMPINKGIDPDINPAYQDINNGVGPGSYSVLNYFNYQTCCWHKVTQDHTGNPDGYFLVVDGGTPNFYSTRVNNLCPNTDYTFSAWSMNMDLLAYPSLTTFIFNVTDTSGNILGQLATAPITVQSSPTWVNNGFTFNTGNNTALKLNLILTSSGNNDFAFDDLELSVCGPTLSLVPTVSACSSKVEIAADLGSGYANPVYQWYKENSDSIWEVVSNAATPTYTDSMPSANDWYKVTVSDGASACSYIEDSILVTLAKPVPDTLTIDSTICNGQSAYGHTTTGIYPLDTIHNTTGCDSILRIVNLTVNPYKRDSVIQIICQPQSFTVGIYTYTTSGIYYDTLSTATCDSIVVLNLTVNPYKKDSIVQSICRGQSFTVGTNTYNVTGLYRDTLSTATCDSIVILNLTVNSCIPPGTVCARDTVDRSICEGDSLVFNGKVYNEPGAYNDTLTTAGCDSVVTLRLTVNPNPFVRVIAGSSEVDRGGVVQLGATPSFLSYMWTATNALLDNALIQTPTATINDASWIFLEATDPLTNCKGDDSVFIAIKIQAPCNGIGHIYMPNAFTPNGDGHNDVFKILGDNIVLNEFRVFDRWGEMIFETKDITQGWDGTYRGEMLPGNYVYWISYRGCNDNGVKILKGNVVLIR